MTGLAEPKISVIIPALDEEASIAQVVAGLPPSCEIIVVDNGSSDRTAERAAAAGARVVREPIPGYGRACAAGAAAASSSAEILAFLDGDGSDDPSLMPLLIAPLLAGTHDFAIGSRVRGVREPGSMNAPQLIAGKIAGIVLERLYGVRYTDMCPFRAIRHDAFRMLGMSEQTYGWNVEMQMRAAYYGLRIIELPVTHRNRIGGDSKVSGTLRGTVRAATRILTTMTRIAWETRRSRQRNERTVDA